MFIRLSLTEIPKTGDYIRFNLIQALAVTASEALQGVVLLEGVSSFSGKAGETLV